MMDQLSITLDSLRAFWIQLMGFLPQLIAAVILLVIGWLVAKIIRNLATRFLKLIKLDVVAEKAGIEEFLQKGGVGYDSVTLISNLIYWFIMFTVILAVLNSLGLHAAADLFNRIIFYLPNVIVAVLVLIFGSLLARVVKSLAFTYMTNIGMDGSEVISSVAHWAILIFVVSVALEQLSIGGEILVSAFQIGFGALCLALALAFGLGGKNWAEQILQRVSKK